MYEYMFDNMTVAGIYTTYTIELQQSYGMPIVVYYIVRILACLLRTYTRILERLGGSSTG